MSTSNTMRNFLDHLFPTRKSSLDEEASQFLLQEGESQEWETSVSESKPIVSADFKGETSSTISANARHENLKEKHEPVAPPSEAVLHFGQEIIHDEQYLDPHTANHCGLSALFCRFMVTCEECHLREIAEHNAKLEQDRIRENNARLEQLLAEEPNAGTLHWSPETKTLIFQHFRTGETVTYPM